MEIKDFFRCDDQPRWIEKIRRGDWRPAEYLADLLENGSFNQLAGEGTVYLLTDGEELISFVTLTLQDCIDDKSRYPWLGFFYTFEAYRGHRYGGILLNHAAKEAAKQGYTKVYIATDHEGLYEKYGFIYLENQVSIYGEDSRVYVKNVRNKHECIDLNGQPQIAGEHRGAV
jgi:GNAT superfamily N-acetyltransferase